MQTLRQFLSHSGWTLVVPAMLFIGTVLGGLLLRKILFASVRRWAKRTDSHLDVFIVEGLNGPILIWFFILAVHVATQNSDIPERFLKHIPTTLEVLWLVSLMLAASHSLGNIVRFYGGRVTGGQSVTSLTQKLAQVSVVIVGVIWILKVVFDFNLTPVLTTLGVGGLAVALALQDTLSNLFAGFYTSMSGLVRIGDYIKLNTGEEGYVVDIAWRSTTIRALALELNRHRDWTLAIGVKPAAGDNAQMDALARSFAVVRVIGSYSHRDGVAESIGWDAVKNRPGAESGVGFLILTSTPPPGSTPVAAPRSPPPPAPALPKNP